MPGMAAAVLVGVAGHFLLVNVSRADTSDPASIKVKLVDAFSEQIISDANVEIHSDNGIRCIQAPCDTGGQDWTGISDHDGFIYVPSKAINAVTSITAAGYRSGRDLNKDSEKIADHDWVVELDPDSKVDRFERRLKLTDSQTQKPLSDITMWITNDQNCQPPACSDYSFKGTVNHLGNVYYPLSAVKDNSWIFIDGYRSKKLPDGWVNYKVVLEK
jgi:hypothetical protein